MDTPRLGPCDWTLKIRLPSGTDGECRGDGTPVCVCVCVCGACVVLCLFEIRKESSTPIRRQMFTPTSICVCVNVYVCLRLGACTHLCVSVYV